MAVPDVLGMEWEEAEHLLEEEGWEVTVVRTTPPGVTVAPEEPLRVVRVARGSGRELHVLLAPERFLGPRGSGALPAP